MSDTPQLLLAHHLKALKLPTFLHEYNSFYHWTEELYKVVILEHHGFSGRYVVSRMPAFATEFLELLRIPPERILLDVPKPTVFRSAVLTTIVWHLEAKSHRGVFFALRDAILSGDVSQEPSLGERLWILRGRQFSQRRDTLNAEEVQALLERYGFTCIDMSELPVRRQIAAVQRAKVLGGPHGGGLALSMFLRERSTVIECFSPHHINICFIGICHNLNHKYHQIVSRNTVVTQYPYGVHSAIEMTGDAKPGAIVEARVYQDASDRTRLSLATRSDLTIEAQVSAPGATWIDRQLLAREPVTGGGGFGAEVREAMDRRVNHLVEEGLVRRKRRAATAARGA